MTVTGTITTAAANGGGGPRRVRHWHVIESAAGCRLSDCPASVHVIAAEPTRRFLTLLQEAITAGKAHLAPKTGYWDADYTPWGWRLEKWGDESKKVPRGDCIGWVDTDTHDVYLLPAQSYAVAQALGSAIGDPFTVSARTLHKRLDERGLLKSVDPNREVLTVRVTCDGVRRDFLHLPMRALHVDEKSMDPSILKPDQPDQPDQLDADA